MTKPSLLRGCTKILWGMLFIPTFLQAQSPQELITLQQQKIQYLYAQEHGGMGKLIHGKAYEDYYSSAQGNPFGVSADWTIGSLQTKHLHYPELLIKYDAYRDALVFAADLINEKFIWVNDNQIESFWIKGRQFNYLGRGTEQAAMQVVDLPPGYYELLYEGKSTLYAKRKKGFRPYEDDYEHIGEFYEETLYVSLKNRRFWVIKGKRDWVQFTQDHKDQIEEYIKEQGIRFRSITDDQLLQMITYYDSL